MRERIAILILSFFILTIYSCSKKNDPQPFQVTLEIFFNTGPLIVEYSFGTQSSNPKITYDTLNKAGTPTNSVYDISYLNTLPGNCLYCKATNSTQVLVYRGNTQVYVSNNANGIQTVKYCFN